MKKLGKQVNSLQHAKYDMLEKISKVKDELKKSEQETQDKQAEIRKLQRAVAQWQDQLSDAQNAAKLQEKKFNDKLNKTVEKHNKENKQTHDQINKLDAEVREKLAINQNKSQEITSLTRKLHRLDKDL